MSVWYCLRKTERCCTFPKDSPTVFKPSRTTPKYSIKCRSSTHQNMRAGCDGTIRHLESTGPLMSERSSSVTSAIQIFASEAKGLTKMTPATVLESNHLEISGAEMHALVAELYPICRSITGTGVRETLRRLREAIPLSIHEVPTGTQVFDWTVPREWNIRDAYVKDSTGERIID